MSDDMELEAIRARHNYAEQKGGDMYTPEYSEWSFSQTHRDRATLIAKLDAALAETDEEQVAHLRTRALLTETRAELEKAQRAIRVQSAAVKTLQAAEDSEINVLRKKQTDAHRATVTLDSERAMNATLTDEVERLQAELSAERAKVAELVGAAKATVENYERVNFVRTADFHGSDCSCFRCSIDALSVAVQRAGGE